MPDLVERDAQLTVLHDLLHNCAEGRGRTILIDGPVGCGKTELLYTFANGAERTGIQFLCATCSHTEEALPLGVLGQLFRSRATPDQRDRVAELAGRAQAATSQADQSPGHGLPAAQAQELYQLCLSLLDLANDRPTIIGVDDVQYADPLSLHCLLYLARRLRSAPILLLLTEVTPRPPGYSPLHTDLPPAGECHHLQLAPLSQAAVAAFLQDRGGPAAADRLASTWHAVSGGNPRLLHALVEDDRHSGTEFQRTVIGEAYGRAVLNCVHRSNPAVLSIARELAVFDGSAPPTLLGRLTEVNQESRTRALRALGMAGLQQDGRFRHPAARTAVLDELPWTDQMTLRSRAAQLLHDGGAPVDAVAGQLLAGGQPEAPWATIVLADAAEQAVRVNRVDLAVGYLERATQFTADSRTRNAFRARQSRLEWRLNPATAARHLVALAEAGPAGELAVEDGFPLVRQLVWHGLFDAAAGVLDWVRDAAAGDPERHGPALRDIELWLACTYPPLFAGRAAAAASGHPSRALRTDPRLLSAATITDVLCRGRSDAAIVAAEQILRTTRLSNDEYCGDEAPPLALLALVYADRIEAAQSWCDRLLGEADELGLPTWRGLFGALRAEIAVRQGDFAGAVDSARRAVDLMPGRGWGIAIGLPLGSLILAATRGGRYREAGRYLDEPVPEGMFASRFGLHYLRARGHFHLATDNPAAALADFLGCGDLMRDWRIDMSGLVPWRLDAAEALLAQHKRDEARRLIDGQLAGLGEDQPRVRGAALRLLAAVTPKPKNRIDLLVESVDILENNGDRFELARSLGGLGRTYEAAGEQKRARMVVRRAWHVARKCGAMPLAADLLPTRGLRQEIPRQGKGTVLTEAEHRVAALAAVGYTNRQIASKLYITDSTVEQHLTKVYRKLNVKYRRELPGVLHTDVAGSA
ncbi:helix-turn-helix transcriptional regulator [Kutzneria sp. CA-103260]|uniref:helix-turn-helix transcriptional regulator n=1 Tax=Kutzneria sp. CA-103260 TaxID=2802641 RepID=UPI001BAD9FB7|nr:LuxR family transcriptional regulator [Kutzneria sp. CA-103260]QUQ65298.1 helix-turn-helix transcriptional regulator [Kutzneria sp. CA-103260]